MQTTKFLPGGPVHRQVSIASAKADRTENLFSLSLIMRCILKAKQRNEKLWRLGAKGIYVTAAPGALCIHVEIMAPTTQHVGVQMIDGCYSPSFRGHEDMD